MQEKRNSIFYSIIFGGLLISLFYANYTGWKIYNSDKIIKDNEHHSGSRSFRSSNGFHHK